MQDDSGERSQMPHTLTNANKITLLPNYTTHHAYVKKSLEFRNLLETSGFALQVSQGS